MRPLSLTLISVSLWLIFSTSQAQHTCGTDNLHQQKMENDPHYRLEMENFEEYMQSPRFQRQEHTIGGVTVYRIPVVFHIMHKGEAIGSGTNISKQAILNSLQSLNSRYRKLLNGVGYGNGVDVEIEFSLAVRDPWGNCTDGIVRYNMSGYSNYMSFGVNRNNTNGMDDGDLKALSFWDSYKYYNIWVIYEIDNNEGGSGTQGYAYYASAHGLDYDGAVMLANCITDTMRVTLPHEIGHALNLYHTFEGDATGTTCPVNTTCSTDGDRVCDTPPHIRSASNCPAGTNACDGGSNNDLYYHNYMDYSADICQNMFTAGQKTRMIAALTTTRASLLAENSNMSLVPPTIAVADFAISKTLMCTGSAIQLFDMSSCTPNNFIKSIGWPGISFSWTVTNNAGNTLNFTDQNPLFVVSVAGTYDVIFSITNPSGTSSVTKKGVFIVTGNPITPTCTGSNSSPSAGVGLYYGIYDVYLNTLSHSSEGTLQDITDGTTNGSAYGDFSCVATTTLAANATYSVIINGSFNSGIYEDFKVYIDYNNDGDMADTGEEVAFFDEIQGGVGNQSRSFTTPVTPVFNTPLRMRVISARGGGVENINSSCFVTSRGQIQDYAVIISNKIASVTIAPTPSTTITFGTSVTFTATPTNGGTTPTYQWYINGVLQAATGNTLSSSTLVNGDQIYCVMSSNLANVVASPATSNTLTMVVTGVPQSDFTQNKTTVCTGSTVVYTDNSKQVPTSWSWTFAGGAPGTSAAQNPSVVYNTAGTYNTTLTASNGLGTGTTKTQSSLINVYNAPAAICNTFSRGAGTGGNIGIAKVFFNTINNFSDFYDAVYIDNSCSMITTVKQGSIYALEILGSNSYNQWLRVYIDYNANGIFEAGELVYSPANGMNQFSTTVTIPTTSATTLVRMRVITDYATGGVTPAACPTNAGVGVLAYGQVEDYGIVITANALPISLLSFNAQRIGHSQAHINWELASYSDVHGFNIERSTDGSHYSSIDSILPPHSFSGRVAYSITDPSAPESVAYYRLRTIYTDGSSEYSQSVSISENIASLNSPYVYPVPVTTDEVKIYYGALNGNIQWVLSDVDGRIINKGMLNTSERDNLIHLPEVGNGVYLLRMTTSDKTYLQRITILK